MRRTWTIIAVRDVFSSLKWYQALLGLTSSPPAHDYFGQVLDADGTILTIPSSRRHRVAKSPTGPPGAVGGP